MDNKNTLSHQSERMFVRDVMKAPLLTQEEESLLTHAWYYDQDEKALAKIVSAYGKLVVSIAVRFKHYGLPLNDLIQEGNLGLLYAAKRFDPERNVRFSTYSKWWIRAFIQDFVLRNWSIVRTGSTTSQKILFFNLRRLKNQLSHLSNELMSHEQQTEIADTLHVSLHDVIEMENRLINHDFSLSMTPTNSEEEWLTSIKDERLTPEEQTTFLENSRIHSQWIEKAMQVLNPREVYIIIQRRLNHSPETLENIGKTLGITKERVRQLELRALRKMKHYFLDCYSEAKQSLDFKPYA